MHVVVGGGGVGVGGGGGRESKHKMAFEGPIKIYSWSVEVLICRILHDKFYQLM